MSVGGARSPPFMSRSTRSTGSTKPCSPSRLAGSLEAYSSLPAHLRSLLNDEVLRMRERVIAERLADEAKARVFRQRCARVVADHLLEVHANV